MLMHLLYTMMHVRTVPLKHLPPIRQSSVTSASPFGQLLQLADRHSGLPQPDN
jgi:hypothetical protein